LMKMGAATEFQLRMGLTPSHTRDDGHLFYNYENYAESFINQNGVPTPTSADYFGGTINNIASLIDTNQYDGDNPDPNIAVRSDIGLSEYTNANFFSEDTIINSDFPYPQITQQTPIVERTITNNLWNTTYPRQYYLKNCCGETNEGQGYLLAAVDYLDYWRQQYPLLSFTLPKIPVLDDNVYKDYASLLLPRAVGYSAGLLNYFFRGSIEISLPDSGVYATTDDPNLGFTTITLQARNNTPNNEEMPDGSIELVVKYRLALEDPFQSKAVLTTEDFYYIVVQESNGIRSIPRNTSLDLTFDLNPAIPLYATDVYLQIVYNGKLGNEDGAVAVGFKDISEPTPVDLFNNMDKICLNGTWYDAGSAEAIAQVDTNQNGIADEWDVYAHDLSDAYLKVSPSGSPMPASPQDYTFDPYTVPAGTLYRAYILGDIQLGYGDYAKVAILDANDFWIHDNAVFQWLMTGSTIKNQVDYNVESQEECAKVGADAPCDIRSYPVFYTFRNRNIWGRAGFILDNPKYPPDADCPWELLQDAE
ncbi:MAG: hypothetical protein AABY87_08720, partial [bacterium]